MPFALEPSLVLALCAVALVAGFVDAIAGGGGLLTVPVLLATQGDPRLALATNKGQSVFGAAASLASFWRAGKVDRKRALPTFLAAFFGSLLGVRLLLAMRPEHLRPVALVLLVAVAIYVGTRPSRPEGEAHAPLGVVARHPALAVSSVALAIGAYDGFFGPGTGTLLIAAFSAAFGDPLTRATANAKVANFASNLAAVLGFSLAGAIVWPLALPMAAAQALGSALGARTAIRGGERLVRGVVVAVALAVALRLGWQLLATPG